MPCIALAVLTVKLEPLSSANTRVAIKKEFEVVVRVFDGADFILVVDKVSVQTTVLEMGIKKALRAIESFKQRRLWKNKPESFEIRRKEGVRREARPETTKHDGGDERELAFS